MSDIAIHGVAWVEKDDAWESLVWSKGPRLQVNELQPRYIMPFTIAHEPESHLIIVTMSGKLDTEDYEQGMPIIEGYIREFGKVNLLVQMTDFHGWTAGGVWEDIKFDVNHARDFERIALVGDSSWQEWTAVICKPFTSGHYEGSTSIPQPSCLGQTAQCRRPSRL